MENKNTLCDTLHAGYGGSCTGRCCHLAHRRNSRLFGCTGRRIRIPCRHCILSALLEVPGMKVALAGVQAVRGNWALAADGIFGEGIHLVSGDVGSGKSTLALLLAGL